MVDQSEETAMHAKIDAIMAHGDPALREMLRDLIFEFHNQVMTDPKARVAMKKKKRLLGSKIVNLPFVFRTEKPASEKEAGSGVNYRIPVTLVVAVLLAAFFIPWTKTGVKRTDAPVRVCDVKGNISATGEKIYHLPNSKWYEKTFIDESIGERWFCSEDEARSAGWRISQQ